MSEREQLTAKIEKLKELLQELGKNDEIKKLARKDTETRKLKIEEIKGPECNGCSVCLPCLTTPTPEFEAFIGTYSFNFKP